MICNKCKRKIKSYNVFEGSVLPFIAEHDRKFLCKLCAHFQPERLSEKTSKEEAIV
jgi:hypothetical protein